MEGERGGNRDTAIPPSSVLKGRLSDVFVPALVGGATSALLRRLGTRATLDDPTEGRSASAPAIEAALTRLARGWHDAQASYRPLASTTGVDCDVAEAVLDLSPDGTPTPMPIAVVAERRSMREIDVRLYYAPPGRTDSRTVPPSWAGVGPEPRTPLARDLLEALRAGAIEHACAGFEQDARVVDVHGKVHERERGALAAYLDGLSKLELFAMGSADDGRRCCLEVTRRSEGGRNAAALLVLVRGESGLVRELLAYGSSLA